MYCENCGSKLDENAKFCTICGAAVEDEQPQAEQQPTQQPPIQQQPTQQQPVQNVWNATNPQYGSQYAGGTNAQRSSNGARKTIIILVIVIVVLIAAAAVAAVLLLGRKNDTPADSIKTEQSQTETKEEEQAEQEPEAPHEMTFEEAQQIAAGFSTAELPDLAAFDWYTPSIGSGAAPGFLNGAAPITNPTLVEGGWKMLVVWDPQRVRGAYCWDVENAQIWNQGGDSASMNVTPYIFYEPDLGYTTDMSNQPPVNYLGNWANDALHVSVSYTYMDINYFYEYEGKQYAIGTILAPDGTPGEVALVRP
ncbi:MAG: zinc ribbon domain-containing protein [Clostridia bacterium]|nr:zinc ribbon domain-containing protein [Clostridia bacterium]